jgi:hypothetical protein
MEVIWPYHRLYASAPHIVSNGVSYASEGKGTAGFLKLLDET